MSKSITKRRVVITGLGAVTPIGNNVSDMWSSIKNGRHGIAEVTHFNPSKLEYRLAAEVKNLNYENIISKSVAKRMPEYSLYSCIASKEAVLDSKIDISKEDPYKCGVYVGVGQGSLQVISDSTIRLRDGGGDPKKVPPLVIPMCIPNIASGNVGILLGFKGINFSISSACATGTHSIGEAMRAIQYGYLDVVVAGGAESQITEVGYVGFNNLQALAKTNDPNRASIPFDKDRSGFLISEGSGIVVLEEAEHAKKRGAKIYCELAGYGATCDAYHLTAPDPEGQGAIHSMQFAISDANMQLKDITYINAHGTSTYYNDLYETNAIKKLFGDYAKKLLISSTKSFTGHGLGAAGGIEAVVCAKSLQENWVHGTLNLNNPDPLLDLNYLPNKGESVKLNGVLSNSFGFGGHNATLLFKPYRE